MSAPPTTVLKKHNQQQLEPDQYARSPQNMSRIFQYSNHNQRKCEKTLGQPVKFRCKRVAQALAINQIMAHRLCTGQKNLTAVRTAPGGNDDLRHVTVETVSAMGTSFHFSCRAVVHPASQIS